MTLKVQLYVSVKILKKSRLYDSFTAALRNNKVAISCCARTVTRKCYRSIFRVRAPDLIDETDFFRRFSAVT